MATTYTYELPDGTRFDAAVDLCKGASIITFELKAVPPALRGRIVDAIIVSEPRYVTICAWCETTPPRQAHVVYSHGMCPDCAKRFEGDQ